MSYILCRNPATGEKLAEIPMTPEDRVKEVVVRAQKAQPEWNAKGYRERGRIMMALRNLIYDQLTEIADLISQENGKPVIEAISHDVMPTLDLITYFAKKSESFLKKTKVKLGKWDWMGHQSYLEYYPYGVVAIISPWNFPFSIPLGEVVIALMAGNTVVLKPSEYTALVGQKIAELFLHAGIPDEVFCVIQGDGATGATLTRSGVDKIVFTGSVPTGKKIMAEAAKTLTPVTLELGGKDPLIVLPDADLDLASSAAVWGAFCNSGQVCASVERVYVHESIAKPFIDLVVSKTNQLKQDSASNPDAEVGAMTAAMQVKKVEDQIKEALQRGANILTGGQRNTSLGELFFKPTVITGVDHSFRIIQEETFGPVLPIMTYQTEEEVIIRANDSSYALNAYIWTGDIKRARLLASQLIAGTVNINESVFTYALPQTPWGGPKESGVGRTHGMPGIMDLVQVRHVHVNKKASKKNQFWWYGYSQEKLQMMLALCDGLFGRGLQRLKGMMTFLKLSKKVKTL